MRLGGVNNLAVTFTGSREAKLRRERLSRPGRGEVLLEARCSLISVGTERRCFERDFAPGTHWDAWVTYPFHPGYSFVGTDSEGARVCANAPHAQRAVVRDDLVIPIPDGVGDDDAAWFALASIAQIGLAAAGDIAGEAVAVVGAGPLGQVVAQLARTAGGAAKVIVVGRSQPRVDAAVAHGASGVVASAATAKDEILARTGGEGAAVVFDVTGSEQVLADALRLARRRGTVVLLGDVGDPAGQRLGPELLNAGLRLVGAHFDHSDAAGRRRMAEDFFAAVTDGSVVLDDLISTRVSPWHATSFYLSLTQSDPGRLGAVFDWGRM